MDALDCVWLKETWVGFVKPFELVLWESAFEDSSTWRKFKFSVSVHPHNVAFDRVARTWGK